MILKMNYALKSLPLGYNFHFYVLQTYLYFTFKIRRTGSTTNMCVCVCVILMTANLFMLQRDATLVRQKITPVNNWIKMIK